MSKSLEGKVAIVTGSGQGIGRGIAIFLAREGAKVITNNRKPGGQSANSYRKEDMPEEEYLKMIALKGDAEGTAAQIQAEGGDAKPFYGDVSDFETAKQMVDFAIEEFGRLDIAVNNAAGLGSGSIVSLTESDWDYLTVGKMKGSFNLMHFAVPHMINQGYGRIINCASDAWVGLVDNDAYSAANAGVVGLSWAAARELNRHGITVNVYCPQGSSPSHEVEYNKMLRNIESITGQKPNPELLKVVEADHGDPINIGPFIAFLGSEYGSDISGEVFGVTAAGKITHYSNPKIDNQIRKQEGPWTVEELATTLKPALLGENYISDATKSNWG